MQRIGNICRYLGARGLDAFVIPRNEDARYLLQNDSLNWQELLVVFKNGKAFRISPYDALAMARKYGESTDGLLVEGMEAVDGKGDVAAALSALCRENGAVVVGYEGHEMRAPMYATLLRAQGITLRDVGREDTELFRRVKDVSEVALITRAQRITEQALEELLPYIVPGATENEIRNRLLGNMVRLGAEKYSCALVASGASTGEVHAHATDKKIEPGDIIQFDIGSVYQGYCSDMSRVFALGSVTEEQRRIYDLVREAHEAGIEALAVGKTGREVHNAAVRVFEKAGLADHFTHGLGHNVGMLIHEAPYADPDSEDVFETGHICTIEPGLYFKGRFGMRLEDMIWLSPDGKVDLATTTKELRILK